MTKYTAIATVTYQVEFEDSEDLDLYDQAFDAAADIFDGQFLNLEICDVIQSPAEQVPA